MLVQLYYVHDPMCSWCWAYRPVWQALQSLLQQEDSLGVIPVESILGGLAPDTTNTMPLTQQQQIQSHWQQIQTQLGTEFNFEFWLQCRPQRSTYLACRAVIAAAKQHPKYAELMIVAIQQAYYLQARNPSELDVLCELAQDIGLNSLTFRREINSEWTHDNLAQQIYRSRQMPISGFPSLVLLLEDKLLPIELDYRSANNTYQIIENSLKDFCQFS